MSSDLDKEVKSIQQQILELPDEVLQGLQFSMPWQYEESTASYKDADGFISSRGRGKPDPQATRESMQNEAWRKFHANPQVNTSVRRLIGRATGYGFEVSSPIAQIDNTIEELTYDPRNRLYNFYSKWFGRAKVEGELFLMFTVHKDGFVEVDFVDPACIEGGGVAGGIIFHPTKTLMPLFYCVTPRNSALFEPDFNQFVPQHFELVPSIFIAHYPELIDVARVNPKFKITYSNNSKSRSQAFRNVGGYYRFIVSWDMGLITRRNVSYLRTVIEWLNFYEDLKRYEIDHKKSAGAYVWVIAMEDPRAFKLWLSLTDDEKRKTAIMAKKTPGATLVLPPGFDCKAINPQLPSISEKDNDIMAMITSGTNEPHDVSSGQSKGTFATVKASRGPMSDRDSDEIAIWDRFLRYDFWGSIFLLKQKVANFPKTFKREEVVDFKDKKPVKREIRKRPERFLEISYPMSEIIELEKRAKALMGVKHGNLKETLGIPLHVLAEKLGFGNYRKLRLMAAAEDEQYPELLSTLEMESHQEKNEAEPGRAKKPLDNK